MSKKKNKGPVYERVGTVHPDEVLPFVRETMKGMERPKKTLCSQEIYLDSLRYRTYKVHGLTCVHCGLVGKYFAVERHKNGNDRRYHLNLYAVLENGTERMMTMDHIIPKSKGGRNQTSNTQPMCIKCNEKKADALPAT